MSDLAQIRLDIRYDRRVPDVSPGGCLLTFDWCAGPMIESWDASLDGDWWELLEWGERLTPGDPIGLPYAVVTYDAVVTHD